MAEARLNVVVDAKGAKQGASEVTSSLQKIQASSKATSNEMTRMSSAFSKASGAMARGLGVLGVSWLSLLSISKKYMTNSMEQERVETQLNAVLKATGHSARITADEIKNMASEMQKLTAFGDEEVIGMQNLLLTFKQVKGDEFKKATWAIADMATALDTDLKGATQQVGKALNDPIMGLTLLRRVGITFSESQKDVIKKLTETGKVAEAQRIILDKLEGQFGGSAKASVTTLGGAISQLKNNFGDLFEINSTEKFGAITTAVNRLNKAISTDEIKALAEELGKLSAGALTTAIEGMELFAKNLWAVKYALAGVAGLLVGGPWGALAGIAAMAGFEFGGKMREMNDANRAKQERKNQTVSDFVRDPLGRLGPQQLNPILAEKLKKALQTLKTPPPLDSGVGEDSGSNKKAKKGKEGKSATELMLQGVSDQIKYMNKDGATFLPILDQWQKKFKVLSDEWKSIEDLKVSIKDDVTSKALEKVEESEKASLENMKKIKEEIEEAQKGTDAFYEGLAWQHGQGLMGDDEYLGNLKIALASASAELERLGLDINNVNNWTPEMRSNFEKIQEVVNSGVVKSLDLLNKQFVEGNLTQAQYLERLEELRIKFGSIPLVVSEVDSAITTLHENMANRLPSLSSQVKDSWDAMEMSMARLPSTMSDAFVSAIRNGQSLSDTLKNLLQDIGAVIAKALIMKAIKGVFGFSDGGVFEHPFNEEGFASGGAFRNGHLLAYAKGGIVNKPTLFPFANGTGLMGEAGPEAIMPLKRGADGKLGVEGGGGQGITNLTVNINAVDSQSFTQMMRTNRGVVESLIIENIYRNGSVRKAIQQGV